VAANLGFRRHNSISMTILQQLGELFLQAVPIVLILLVFYLVLRTLFFQPLLKVMAEREARTIGAQKAAEAAQAAATEKIKQYQDEQEAARKKFLDERAARLKDARAKAAIFVGEAKERIASEVIAATADLETTITALAAQVARRVLQSTRPPGAPKETR